MAVAKLPALKKTLPVQLLMTEGALPPLKRIIIFPVMPSPSKSQIITGWEITLPVFPCSPLKDNHI